MEGGKESSKAFLKLSLGKYSFSRKVFSVKTNRASETSREL
jgi:hypothetical protein